jgi:hypothetical protein
MAFKLKEAGACEDKKFVLFDYFSEEVGEVSGLTVNSLVLNRRKFYYHIAAPIEGHIAFLGNMAKHITCSRQLVKKVAFHDYGVSVEVYAETMSGHSEVANPKKFRRKQSEAAPVWLFYCRRKPEAVIFNGKSAEVCWKNGILKVKDEDFETTDATESDEIKVFLKNHH